jgi:hypothetical protein
MVNKAMGAARRARLGTGSTAWPVTWPTTLLTSRVIDYWRSVKKGSATC